MSRRARVSASAATARVESGRADIFSITFVAIATAALTSCHSNIPAANAFVTRSTNVCGGKGVSNLFTATAGQEAQAGFLEDAFNGEKEADGAAAAAAVATASGASIDDGQVRGPAEVLVYDTSLRGEFISAALRVSRHLLGFEHILCFFLVFIARRTSTPSFFNLHTKQTERKANQCQCHVTTSSRLPTSFPRR